MNKYLAAWSAVACLALSARLEAQDTRVGTWLETRFHRVHLLNGNFIDGQLVSDSPKLVVLKVGGGEMSIRKDLILRNSKGDLRIEFMKMRSYQEPPKLEPVIDSGARDRGPKETSAPPAAPAAPGVEAEAVTLTGSMTEKLQQGRDLLKSGTPGRKKGTLDALAQLGPEAAPVIVENLGDLEDDLLVMAGVVLQNMKNAEMVPAMKRLLGHDRASVQEQALLVIGSTGVARDDGPTVRGLLRDAQPAVRSAAMIALRHLADFESFDQVAEHLTDSNSRVRTVALATLGDFAQKGALSERFAAVLAQSLERADGEARMELLKEAAGLGSKDLGPVLSRLAEDSDPMVRSHAIMGLGKIGSEEYQQLILDKLVTEREYWPRIQVAGAAQAMRIEKAIDPLIEWLSDDNKEIRSAAVRALRIITRQNLGPDRTTWEEWREKTK